METNSLTEVTSANFITELQNSKARMNLELYARHFIFLLKTYPLLALFCKWDNGSQER